MLYRMRWITRSPSARTSNSSPCKCRAGRLVMTPAQTPGSYRTTLLRGLRQHLPNATPSLGWEGMASRRDTPLSLNARCFARTVVQISHQMTALVQNVESCQHIENTLGSAINGLPRNAILLPPGLAVLPPGLAALRKGRCGQLQPRRSSVFQPPGLPSGIGRGGVGGFDGIAEVSSLVRGNQEERACSPAFAYCCQRPRSPSNLDYTRPGELALITLRSQARM